MDQASTSAMVAPTVHALPKYEVYIFNMCLHAAHHAIVLAWGGISALEWAGPWLGLLGQHGPSAVLPGFALQACCKKSHKSQGCGRLVAIGPLETADWPIAFAISEFVGRGVLFLPPIPPGAKCRPHFQFTALPSHATSCYQ